MIESFRGRPYAEQRVREIIDWARRENPFYRRWITDPENPPILDRSTVLEHNDELLDGNPVTGSTSGSTGVPVRFSQSEDWRRRAGADVQRFVRSLGGPVQVVRIVYIPQGTPPRDDTLSISVPVSDQIAFIMHRRKEVGTVGITTYPTNAMMLAEEVLRIGVDMGCITRFGLYAESIEPFHLESLRRAFPNARIWTTYSAMEFGLIAWVCPHEPSFHHISAERLGVEVLRDDGKPAAPGECGRVVITDYFNRASPFIRYEIGDYAVRGRCPCGRITLPALSAIHGKTRGALLHRNGARILFAELSVALKAIPGIRQYQVLQTGIEEFTVRVVSPRTIDREVDAAFIDHFGYLPESLRTEYLDEIPRGINGKFHASICTV